MIRCLLSALERLLFFAAFVPVVVLCCYVWSHIDETEEEMI